MLIIIKDELNNKTEQKELFLGIEPKIGEEIHIGDDFLYKIERIIIAKLPESSAKKCIVVTPSMSVNLFNSEHNTNINDLP